MTFTAGEKVFSIPTRTGRVLVSAGSLAASGKCVSIPTRAGNVVLPLGSISPGDKVISVMTKTGRVLVKTGAGGISGLYLLGTPNYGDPYSGKILRSSTGTSWSIKNEEAEYGYLYAFARNGSRCLATIAGDGRGGVLLSTDSGNTWEFVVDPTESTYCNHHGAVFLSSTVALVIEESGSPASGKVLKSTDGGDTWDVAESDMGANLYGIADGGDGLVFACGRGVSPALNSQIWRSGDSGDSWALVYEQPVGIPAGRVWDIIYRDGVVIAASESGIVRSTDDGDNWSMVYTTYPTNPDALFVSSWTKLIRCDGDYIMAVHRYMNNNYNLVSDDDGATWSEQSTGIPDIGGATYLKDGVVMVGTYTSGKLYTTPDHGANWTEVPDVTYQTSALAYL